MTEPIIPLIMCGGAAAAEGALSAALTLTIPASRAAE
jgi:hypothetical protein